MQKYSPVYVVVTTTNQFRLYDVRSARSGITHCKHGQTSLELHTGGVIDVNAESEKVICDFDDYKPIPVEAAKPAAKKVPGTATGSLKAALKNPTLRASSPLKAALKKSGHGVPRTSIKRETVPTTSNERRTTNRATSRLLNDERMFAYEAIRVPSKAWLEEQQENLEAAAKRQANLTSVRPTVHEIPASSNRDVEARKRDMEGPSAFSPTQDLPDFFRTVDDQAPGRE
ncbi:hypothetical protein M413DRAFT_28048 [Hebeloma cylindrosporum]|uniref:Uncharacterized protein n=1 Tax=Hebeloma cylindrosporum TaxID=76867 RepID=A0A0C3CBD5_HEBCY|nr:hypothetical protein M413DRAFT_28048 [Hebeloma cylindrosporum h7]